MGRGEGDCNAVNVKIETPRLILRPWREEDVEQLRQGLNDLNVAKWLAFVPHPYSAADAKNWIKKCREIASAGIRPAAYEFAVELKPKRIVIGGVSLNKIDWEAGTAGGGIWIASDHHGHGYGREAFEAKIRFAFCELGLTKLVNGYFEGNENSWEMQRKLGYRRIAEVPRRCMADERPTIEHVTMLLRSEWEGRKNES